MPIDMSQFVQVFFDEADEGLAEMEKLLLAVDAEQPDNEDLNAIFRAAHSIKGGSSTFGLNNITEVTHVLESLLDRIRQGEMALTTQLIDAFLSTKDVIKMLLDGHRHGADVDQEAAANAQMLLRSFMDQKPADKHVESNAKSTRQTQVKHYAIRFPQVDERELEALKEELGLLGGVANNPIGGIGVSLVLTTTSSKQDIVDICTFIVDEAALSVEQLDADPFSNEVTEEERDQGFGFFMPLPATPVPSTNTVDVKPPHEEVHEEHSSDKKNSKREHEKGAGHESSSIRVGVEKVDQLINLVGELVITQAMIEQRSSELDPMQYEKLINSIHQLQRNTRELQESVMSIRMMPMDYVFSRFPRMVRDIAGKMGKHIEFVTHGAATELDKGLIERIIDPLTHLVRNSLDHGIEMPEVRKAAGKNPTGILSLSAEHSGGNIIIEVSDDGGGLNRQKILAKAQSRGMNVSESMKDFDVWQLIFEPGFSTAEQVTDVSGRGVGMDVVKRNILSMGGAVDIKSSPGFGTTISISLPLTLAILDGMSIRIGTEVYILPLGYIVESLKPSEADLKDISGQGQVIKVREEYLPLIPLYQVFNVTPKETDPTKGLVVILESDGRKAALFVDDLIGQQQIVVKNLESNYRKVAGISGATILGDGGVALIVDVAALLRTSKQLSEDAIFS
jgi:two-component system chemotaxis sensor kinase CheA